MWGLIGHEGVVAFLEQSLAQGRLAHSYLLSGPQGVGKGTLALALAQRLNCVGSLPPCQECPQCRRIAAGLHTDVAVIELREQERELGIQRIREIQHTLSLKPFEGRYRVALIRDAERMSHEAANALLKTLEEPPAEVVLLLTTTEEEQVLPTIRSRCQRLSLFSVRWAALTNALQEHHGVVGEEAERLAAYAQGCPGRALAALEHPEVLSVRAQHFSRLKAILEGDVDLRLAEAARLTAQFSGQREAALESARQWQEWWRDLLLVKSGCQEGLVNIQERPDYLRYSLGIGLGDIRSALASLRGALKQLEQNANPRLVLDVLVLRLPRPSSTDTRS